jgi:hypothetical protein
MSDLTERHWVTIGIFSLTFFMLGMTIQNPKLWEIKLFEVVFQAVVLTGLLNLILAFHFSANKGSEVARENTGKLADAFKAAATAGGNATDAAAEGASAVADAAADKAHEFTDPAMDKDKAQ